MKKTILSLAILSCIGIAQAEYFIQIPVDVTFVKGEGQPSSPIDPEAPIEPEIDCETQAAQYPEECVEDLAAWDKFATDNGLTFDENWNGLVWRSKALTALPTEPYPNSNVFNGIDLYNNKLTNLEGFKSINSIGTNLYIYANKLNDISGLMNLQTVGGNIYLQNNQLTNVNGLNSLNYVGGSIRLDNNQLNNITGLSNAEIVRTINIDKTYAGPKLSANSRFCLLNAGPKFTTGYAKKIQVCEPGSDTWEFFAFDKGYEYGADWNSIAWASKGLTKIPTEAYPNSNPTSSIALSSNKLQNVDGLVGLNSVGANLALQSNGLYNIDGLQDLTNVSGYLYLYNNNLTNIDALANLTNVGSSLFLYSNQLTDLNGLNNLTYVGNNFDVYNNNISDITGVSNINVRGEIKIDSTYNGPKLSSETTFCTMNSATKFSTGFAQKSQLCEPGSDTWESFAFDKGLSYGTGWNTLDWRSKSLVALPTEPYPNNNPNSNMYFNGNKLESVDGLLSIQTIGGHLYLNTNNLTDINGLKNLTSVANHLLLYGNQLTNVDGLAELTNVGSSLYLYNNQLTNVNGLSKLQTVGSSLYLHNNAITDLTGLSNVNVGGIIRIDSSYSGPKLAADSRFCTLNSAAKFDTSYGQKSQICEEGLVTWESFAFDNALSYGANWNTISWASNSLTSIPSEPYPNANPTGLIDLYSNQLTDIEGLSSLNTIGGNLHLYSNQITNLNGLRNLTSVNGTLSFYSNNVENLDGLNKLTTVTRNFMGYSNKLNNVNGLSNLMTVGGVLYLNNNNITDITGLSNANIASTIRIDSTYNGPKMASDSRFCTLNSASKFGSSYAQKSQICEEGLVTWESFAFDNALSYGANWNTIEWGSMGFTEIPSEAYPNANPTSYIYLNSNQLTDVEGLSSLNSTGGNLHLYTNKLTTLNGLRNLTSVDGALSFYSNSLTDLEGLNKLTTVNGNFMGYTNSLTNVNALSNLMTVGGVMYLNNNQITDIRGLSNANIAGTIRIDATYNGPKMAADSRFCTLNSASKFAAGYAQKSQVCEEGTVTWASFAFDNALSYPSNWGSLNWSSKSLTAIPAEPYPNSNPSSFILLNNNQLTDIEGLSGIKTAGDNITLYSNQLTNINGLRNLTSVRGSLSFYSNKLTNLDGLNNLTSVSGNFIGYSNSLTNVNGLSNLMTVGGYLYLHNNPLTDITGLLNVKVTGYIRIDTSYNGPKISASSRFCTLNADSRFPAGYAQKSQLCEM